MKLNNDLYEYDKAAALLAILDILRRFGDDHNKREMQEKLLEEYGISLSRNTFAAKLKTLDRCGYTLSESADGSHYVFEGREFTDAQLRVLIDCLIYNSVVGPDTAKKMIAELCDLGSESIRKSCSKFQNKVSGRKNSSDIVIKNLETIQRAISANAKITCNYEIRNHNLNEVNKYPKDITVSPFELTLSDGRYILICAIDGEEDFTHFYIDKLRNISIKKEPACRLNKFLSALGYNDMNDYISSQPILCGGRIERFTLKIDNEILDDFIEDYGSDDYRKQTSHKENDGYNTVLVIRTSANSLKRLIMPYLDKIVVLDKPGFYESIKELYETGMHNQRMAELAGKNIPLRGMLCRTIEEAIRFCDVNDYNHINIRSRKKNEKIDLSQLDGADWIESINFNGYDISGQRFPENLTELRRVSLIRCKYDLETITELDQVTDFRLTDISAEALDQLSHKTDITRFEMISSTIRPDISNIDSLGSIKNLGFLKDWKQLKKLAIVGYPELNDISALSDKKELRSLELNQCPKITSIDTLKNLSDLRMVYIKECSVSEEQIEELSRALPQSTIYSEKYLYKGGEKTERDTKGSHARR